MSREHDHLRGWFRAIAALLGLVALFSARTASAWEYPLLPHVQGLAFFPETPNTGQRTGFLLSAVYPNECWHLVDAGFPDSAHVRIIIAPDNDCGDSLSTWTAGWDMGILSAGMHSLTVHCTLSYPVGPTTEEEITVPFEVVAGTPPPPPPPPPGEGSPLLLQYEVLPPQPQPGEAVTLKLTGRSPFECTLIRDEQVLDQSHVAMTFEREDVCVDTLRAWQRTFAMGGYEIGEHFVDIALHVVWPESTSTVHTGALIRVDDPNPPPPPPPIDSVKAGLSASTPNPFSDRTTFGVSLDDPQPADVGVFDLAGRRVATIHHGMLPRGTSQMGWDGRRRDGSRAAGGIYFYRLVLPGRIVTRRVVLLSAP